MTPSGSEFVVLHTTNPGVIGLSCVNLAIYLNVAAAGEKAREALEEIWRSRGVGQVRTQTGVRSIQIESVFEFVGDRCKMCPPPLPTGGGTRLVCPEADLFCANGFS